MTIKTDYSHYLTAPTIDAAMSAMSATLADEMRLRAMTDAFANEPIAPGKWSRKELLGHLIDSAGNNTQRFVRAQIPAHLTDGVLRLQGYAQNDWVRVQSYQTENWSAVIDLWLAMNRHMLHIITTFDRTLLATPIAVGNSAPVPVENIIVDYAGHLLHHYRQITAP